MILFLSKLRFATLKKFGLAANDLYALKNDASNNQNTSVYEKIWLEYQIDTLKIPIKTKFNTTEEIVLGENRSRPDGLFVEPANGKIWYFSFLGCATHG